MAKSPFWLSENVTLYLRNCTFHAMRIQPIDTIFPERFNDPANVRQVNPGTY
jgi:hypothetical protein